MRTITPSIKAFAVGLLCACALLLTAVPNAWADSEKYPVWVSGTQITSENAEDVLGDGTVSFRIEENNIGMLVLDNAYLDAAYFPEEGPDAEDAAVIFVAPGMHLRVEIKGECTFSNGDKISGGGYLFGIFTASSGADDDWLELVGDGTLTVNMSERGATGQGLFCFYAEDVNLIVAGPTINANITGIPGEKSTSDFGFYAGQVEFWGSIVNIAFEGEHAVAFGIYADSVKISDGDITIDAQVNNHVSGINGNANPTVRIEDGAALDIHCVGGDQSSIWGIMGTKTTLGSKTQTKVTVEGGNSASGYALAGPDVIIYESAALEATGINAAFTNVPDTSNYAGMTALVGADGTVEVWDGETPLAGGPTRYTYVCIPGAKNITRIAGDYANETAGEISKTAFPDGCEWVVIARDDDYADALGATGLAGTLECPIILTARDELSEAAATEIKRLGATHAYVIGGTGAISEQVDTDLAALGVTVEPRVWGVNSYDTSLACAKMIDSLKGESDVMVVVAMSTNFQDALSISPVAYKMRMPLILQTWGDTSADRGFTPEVEDYLTYKAPLVVGGPGAIFDASIEKVFSSSLVLRIYGETGYDTSNEIAHWAVRQGILDRSNIVVACGAQAPKGVDALAGSALAGSLGCPILLVNANEEMEESNTATIDGFLSKSAISVKQAYVLGGTYVIPEELYKQVAEVIRAEA